MSQKTPENSQNKCLELGIDELQLSALPVAGRPALNGFSPASSFSSQPSVSSVD